MSPRLPAYLFRCWCVVALVLAWLTGDAVAQVMTVSGVAFCAAVALRIDENTDAEQRRAEMHARRRREALEGLMLKMKGEQ